MVPANNTPQFFLILESYSRVQPAEWHDKHLGKAVLAAKGSAGAGVSAWRARMWQEALGDSCCPLEEQAY